VKAGYVEEGVKRDSILGVPQGSVISPILSNIYLHEFDMFINKLIEVYHSKEKDITKPIPEYQKVTRRIQYLREKLSNVKDQDLLNELKGLIKKRKGMMSRVVVGTRMKYVRYADD
jgi:retron-type reverse transcriptase